MPENKTETLKTIIQIRTSDDGSKVSVSSELFPLRNEHPETLMLTCEKALEKTIACRKSLRDVLAKLPPEMIGPLRMSLQQVTEQAILADPNANTTDALREMKESIEMQQL